VPSLNLSRLSSSFCLGLVSSLTVSISVDQSEGICKVFLFEMKRERERERGEEGADGRTPEP